MTSLDTYRLLGRSGLRVSPLALGTMTFGNDWGWGSEPDEARQIFDAYVDAGGNFVDTASNYTNGNAEQLLGEFITENRDKLVIASKYSLLRIPGDPNSGGNHRKSMISSVEQSLRRLRTDYLDLLYLHAWDDSTPAEEILRAMDDLVHAGKVLYLGISNSPAWQAARMRTVADLRGWAPLIALQVPYSLGERTVERELLPMAQALGLGVVPYSPLAGGVLTGKYDQAHLGLDPAVPMTGSRRNVAIANGQLTARTLDITETVRRIAADLGVTPAQVALAWPLHHPAVTAPIIGARTLKQLVEDLGALPVRLEPEHLDRLATASSYAPGHPHDFLASPLGRAILFGDVVIEGLNG
ncbi:aldo/keto reductase [Pseudonocardiaceae bacterium YIM PH 21723]|nr:aldo/keto reductase [Pseudonocardiaceae bacterium YIM PH 21723]